MQDNSINVTYTPNVIPASLGQILSMIKLRIEYENKKGLTGTDRMTFVISGAPGWGKSMGTENLFNSMSIASSFLSGTSVGPAEINGVLTSMRDNGKEVGQWVRLPALPVPESEGGPAKCVLLIDDFAKAMEDIQNEFAMLITSRRTSGGNYEYPSMGNFVLTCNRPGVDNSSDKPIPSYVRSRCMWFEVQQDPRDWTEWAVAHDVNPNVVGFVRFQPTAIMDKPKETGPESCPRTMTAAASVVDMWEEKIITKDVALNMIAGLIGETHAYELRGFMEVRDRMPDLEKIIDGSNLVAPDRNDLALAWNIVTALGTLFRVRTGKDKLKVADGITRFCHEAKSVAGDPLDMEWTVALLRDCHRHDSKALKKGAGAKRWQAIADTLQEHAKWDDVELPAVDLSKVAK